MRWRRARCRSSLMHSSSESPRALRCWTASCIASHRRVRHHCIWMSTAPLATWVYNPSRREDGVRRAAPPTSSPFVFNVLAPSPALAVFCLRILSTLSFLVDHSSFKFQVSRVFTADAQDTPSNVRAIMVYVRSRKFCCCLPVRFGVFCESLLGMAVGGLFAVGGWLTVHDMRMWRRLVSNCGRMSADIAPCAQSRVRSTHRSLGPRRPPYGSSLWSPL